MARYKPMGDVLVVAPPRKTVVEVSARELNRDTAGVLARVQAGGRAIVTKHGAPIAVLMEVEEAVGLCGTNEAAAQARGGAPALRGRTRCGVTPPRPEP